MAGERKHINYKNKKAIKEIATEQHQNDSDISEQNVIHKVSCK